MAGKTNQYISKAVNFLNRVSGKTNRDWKTKLRVMEDLERKPMTLNRAKRLAEVEKGRTFQTRVKTGLIGTTAATAGFMGMHKYHQHKDNQILKRIDRMYADHNWDRN